MKQENITKNFKETQKLGEKIAKEILDLGFPKAAFGKPKAAFGKPKEAFVIGLQGKLGGGKTTFLQGFAKGLGIKEKILSPTFVIMKKFQVSSFRFQEFYHIDCYRIQKPKELLDLGFKEIIKNSKNIVAVEWADKIKKILPKNFLKIKFSVGADENIRKITFN